MRQRGCENIPFKKNDNDFFLFRRMTKAPSSQTTAKVKPQGSATLRSPVRCWALCRNRNRCKAIVQSREGEPIPIPYCNSHLKHGDYALKIIDHPFAGKCAVARYDLPAKYRLIFHGKRGKARTSDKDDRSMSFYPPNPKTGSNYIPSTRTQRTDNYNGVLNPKGTGDLMQFASAPGPGERQNCKSTFKYFGKRNGVLGGMEFISVEAIPRNTMILFNYGPGWWAARDMSPSDVGTKQFPAPKRKPKQIKSHNNHCTIT